MSKSCLNDLIELDENGNTSKTRSVATSSVTQPLWEVAQVGMQPAIGKKSGDKEAWLCPRVCFKSSVLQSNPVCRLIYKGGSGDRHPKKQIIVTFPKDPHNRRCLEMQMPQKRKAGASVEVISKKLAVSISENASATVTMKLTDTNEALTIKLQN